MAMEEEEEVRPKFLGWLVPLSIVLAALVHPNTALAQTAAAAGAWMCPCPGRLPVPLGGAASCTIACFGGSGIGGAANMLRGAAGVGAVLGVLNMLGDSQADSAAAAQSQAAAAAEAQRQAAAAAAAAAAENAKNRLLGELQGDVSAPPPAPSSSGTVTVNGVPLMADGDTAPGPTASQFPVGGPPPATSGSTAAGPTEAGQVAVNIDGPQPTLSSGPQTASLPSDASAGPALGGEPPEIPSPTVTSYMKNAKEFFADKVKDASFETATKTTFGDSAASAALDAGKWAESGTGPYAMAAAIMFNAAHLPEYIFPKILAAARGDLSPGEANGLTIQAVNHLYDFDTPVNAAIADGPAAVAGNAVTEGLASLASSYLPVADELKEMNAEAIHNLAQDLPKIAKFWTSAPEDQP